jgi:hypothetical protein
MHILTEVLEADRFDGYVDCFKQTFSLDSTPAQLDLSDCDLGYYLLGVP